MPTFLLRNCATSRAYPNHFHVILKMEDGYDLEVGGISETVGRSTDVFWAWSCSGRNGRAADRQTAMAAFKAAWSNTDVQLAEMRREQESTEWKYALWENGYSRKMGKGPLRCTCGEMFETSDHDATRLHISHITKRSGEPCAISIR